MMTKYLISFPGPAMDIPDEDIAAVGEAAHAVIREAKEAGVYVTVVAFWHRYLALRAVACGRPGS
jgi:hypothetical protein